MIVAGHSVERECYWGFIVCSDDLWDFGGNIKDSRKVYKSLRENIIIGLAVSRCKNIASNSAQYLSYSLRIYLLFKAGHLL